MRVIAVYVEEDVYRSFLKEGSWSFVDEIVIIYLGHS